VLGLISLAAKMSRWRPSPRRMRAFLINWSAHMTKHFGAAIKGVKWTSGPYSSKGEAVLSAQGLEGGGIYSISRGVREGHPLALDLLPNMTVAEITAKLSKPRGKASMANIMRKALKLDPVKIAVLQEMARPLPQDTKALAKLLKALPIKHAGLRPMDQAISTAGRSEEHTSELQSLTNHVCRPPL